MLASHHCGRHVNIIEALRPMVKSTSEFGEFSLDSKKLPAAIKDHAFTSGGYPYSERFDRDVYDQRLPLLQIELLKLQAWAREAGERMVIVMEGRDASGKGGTIARFLQHMPPRSTRSVALAKPSEAEQGQWYFQRYCAQLPTRGEIVLFDRSWYNRAAVELVNGFCTKEQIKQFLKEVPAFERMLVRDGVRLFKIFLDVGHEMQLKRLWARRQDPLKQWKLSPIDFKAVHQWEAYSKAFRRMFEKSDSEEAPWTVILANDKLRTRLAALEVVLSHIDYVGKDKDLVGAPDKKIVGNGQFFCNRH